TMLLRKAPDARFRPPAVYVFLDQEVDVAACGNLRKVRDGDDLMARRELVHALRHLRRDGSRDSHIDLIENEDREFLVPGEDRLQGQHDAADFTSGGNASQRPGFLAEVCRDVEFDRLIARLRCGESPAVQMDPSITI